MSISPLFKGDTPLIYNTALEDDNSIFPLPNDATKYTLYIHDPFTVRTGTGTVSNINTALGTWQYQATSADTSVTGVITMWWIIQLSNGPRTFDPQKVLIEDPAQV